MTTTDQLTAALEWLHLFRRYGTALAMDAPDDVRQINFRRLQAAMQSKELAALIEEMEKANVQGT